MTSSLSFLHLFFISLFSYIGWSWLHSTLNLLHNAVLSSQTKPQPLSVCLDEI